MEGVYVLLPWLSIFVRPLHSITLKFLFLTEGLSFYADQWFHNVESIVTYIRHVGCSNSYLRVPWKGSTGSTRIELLNSITFYKTNLSSCLPFSNLFFFAVQVDWMYFVAFAGVAVGLVVYSGYKNIYMFSLFVQRSSSESNGWLFYVLAQL